MDKKWLEHLLQQSHEDAYRWACHCCHQDLEMAKDALQMVYVKILDGKARFSQKSSAKTWLFSVIRFTVIDELKKANGKKWVDLEVIKETSEEHQNPVMNFEQYLDKLSGKQREVLLLVFYHDLTIEAAAEVLGCSLGTARTHYSRGKEKLRSLIEKENVR